MRQPVIAQVFDAPSEMIVRSSMPGRVASESKRAVVDEPRVDLVGEHPDLRMPREDLGDRVEIARAQHAAGRIVRRVENQQPRLRRDLRFELGRIEREVARLAQVDRHRHRAVGDDLRFVDRKSGDRIDHFVAGAVVGDRRDRVGDERLGARADDDVLRAECRGRAARRCPVAAAARSSSMPADGV